MSIDIQYKIKNDPLLKKYLKENSHWYKYLNRDDIYFKDFVNEMKKNYHLNTSDKINNVLDTIDFIQTMVNTLN